MVMQKLNCFQVYSKGISGEVNLLVDKIWLENDRIYFRVLKKLSTEKNHLKKEKQAKIYSIHEKDIYSIRCRLYF
jgi:hypothetical protein